jgi:protoheme IX farnesyltransferase
VVAVPGRIDLTAVVLASFVMLWTPIHIWSLAIRCKDDYARASIPMLPVAVGVRSSARYIGPASLVFGAVSGLFVLDGGVRLLMPVAALILALAGGLMVGSTWLMRSPTGEHAWALFKFTSPYLALLFVLLAVNSIAAGRVDVSQLNEGRHDGLFVSAWKRADCEPARCQAGIPCGAVSRAREQT